MFGNLGDMAKLMSLAKELPARIKQVKAELAETFFEGTSPCGAVCAVVAGDFTVKEIRFSASPDPGAVAAAVNSALDAAKAGVQSKMREAAGGVDLPDIF